MGLNEADTRAKLIDPLLVKAGWNPADKSRVGIEIPVDGYDAEPWNGVTDYILLDETGNVLAVVEAKKSVRNPREADEQLRHYVTEIAKRQAYAPFGFMTNGRTTSFWEVGIANPRVVANVFSPEDLANLLYLRQNQKSLESTPINNAIVDRPYQHEAVRRVAETFSQGKRRALLVMATGTGKTRTTMGIIDLFLRSNQARRVLFLADRDALVDQALTDGFKAHLPNEPRDRIYTHSIDKTKRLFVATLQTMSACFEKFSPGFFDLIVYDEVHRSIFNRFTEVIEYFDARMIGLTATPADFVDRDTFRVFQCDTQAPTFLYDYPTAVKDKYLVDYSLYQAHTGFQRRGIKGVDLSEEDRNSLIAQGIDPDVIDYSGTEIEVMISNKDTLRKQWEEVMIACLKDQSGQLPGKTIVFGMTKKHAERIREVFEEMYPQYVDIATVITSSTERVRDGSYGDGLISKFKKNDKPRIAVSVDMLDTGVDVPEVVNLVFMKPVQSRIKLWQMVGRGTRSDAACKFKDRLPEGKKTEFKVIDFWQNDFNKKADDKVPAEIPVLVSVFNTRLKIIETCFNDPISDAFKQAIFDLRAQVARIPVESFPVRKVLGEIEQAWTDGFWAVLTKDKINFLRLKVGPLLRFAPNVDVAAETFTNKMERLKLQSIKARQSSKFLSATNETEKVDALRSFLPPDLLESISDDVSRLPSYVHEDAKKTPSIKLCLSTDLVQAAPQALTQAIADLAREMRNRRERPSAFLAIDLPDFLESRGYISLGEGGKQVYVEEYRKRVESRIFAIVETHPVIEAIRQGREVSDFDLAELERTLHHELAATDVQLSSSNIQKAYGIKVDNFLAFLKFVLSIDAIPDYSTVVQHCFDRFIVDHRYSADQIRFLRSVQEVFMTKRHLSEADLYEAPLTTYGRNAVERYLSRPEIGELLTMTGRLAV